MADALIPFLLASLAGMPCSGLDMDKWQQVNQERVRLCSSSPPQEACRVCQNHERLVNGV